jgi:hypothetical protein
MIKIPPIFSYLLKSQNVLEAMAFHKMTLSIMPFNFTTKNGHKGISESAI